MNHFCEGVYFTSITHVSLISNLILGFLSLWVKYFTTSQLSFFFFPVVKSLRLDPLWPQAEALRVDPQPLSLGRKHPAVGTKKKRPKNPGKHRECCWGKPGKSKVDGGNEGTALRLCFPGRCFFPLVGLLLLVGWRLLFVLFEDRGSWTFPYMVPSNGWKNSPSLRVFRNGTPTGTRTGRWVPVSSGIQLM